MGYCGGREGDVNDWLLSKHIPAHLYYIVQKGKQKFLKGHPFGLSNLLYILGKSCQNFMFSVEDPLPNVDKSQYGSDYHIISIWQ